MEAARLKPVEDRIDRGINGLPAAGACAYGVDKVYPSSSVCGIPGNTVAPTPKPTPAINSGMDNVVDGKVTKNLGTDMLSPSNKISNGAGKLYSGSPDHDQDDLSLTAEGMGTQKLESAFASHRDVSNSRGTEVKNEQ